VPRIALRLLFVGALSFGCATFRPHPLDSSPFTERAQTQQRDGLRVTVSVLSRSEAKQAFGVDLEQQQIQPVWLEIENSSPVPYVLILSGTDPAYFSAREAAYKSHFLMRPGTNAKMDRLFHDSDLDLFVGPSDRSAGFVFTNLKLGTKQVRVMFYGPRRVETFEFYVAVPGFVADYHELDFDALLAQDFQEFEDEQSFREALAALPCCTTRADGSGKGDPLNLIIVGNPDDVASAFIRSGWDETEKLTLASAWRTFRAFFGGTYKYSPMSSLFVYGRGQDAGYQKARDTIHERNHLRVWLSDMKFRGEHVWVGTITRDIGVYFTTRAWNLTTHAIDPAVDEAREYIREDFQVSQAVERWGLVRGVGYASDDEPHRNIMNAPWWTDGLRMVVELSKRSIPMQEQGFFYWDWSDDGEIDEEFNRMLRELSE
jgi:hypothetical protein